MAKEPKSNRLPFRRLHGRGIANNELEFGYIAGVFGVHGEVRLHMHNPASELLSGPLDLVLVSPDGSRFAVTCEARPGAGKRIIGRLSGLSDRELAASLKGYRLGLSKDVLPAPSEDEFYVHEVIGAAVWADGEERGTIKAVHSTAEHDVFELQTTSGLVFIPVLQEFIVSMDLAHGRVEVAVSAFLEE